MQHVAHKHAARKPPRRLLTHSGINTFMALLGETSQRLSDTGFLFISAMCNETHITRCAATSRKTPREDLTQNTCEEIAGTCADDWMEAKVAQVHCTRQQQSYHLERRAFGVEIFNVFRTTFTILTTRGTIYFQFITPSV